MHASMIVTLAATGCAFLIFLMLLTGTTLGHRRREQVHRYFFVMLLCCVVGSGCEVFSALLLDATEPGHIVLFWLVSFLDYAFADLALLLFALWMYEYLSMKLRISKKPFLLMAALCGANILALAIAQALLLHAQLTGIPYHLTTDIGKLAQAVPMLVFVFVFALAIKHKKHLKTRELVSLLLYPIFPLICYGIEAMFSRTWVSWLGTAVSLFLVYVNIQADLRHALHEKELELAESRIRTMLSQIQPHFIFNSLSAINHLCRDNPEARRAILAFSEYLRVNMDALTQKEPIPFEQELAHVKQYLWLEQQRFEERLQVVYDIEETDFVLPVLTVQPMVENAVRHGIMTKKEGGTVTIRAEKVTEGCRVTIRDDGAGFDPAAVREEQGHVGIANVRSRLETLCGGSLVIESAPGTGTVATILIPKREVKTP